jgi:hypothetical protein
LEADHLSFLMERSWFNASAGGVLFFSSQNGHKWTNKKIQMDLNFYVNTRHGFFTKMLQATVGTRLWITRIAPR